jgi:DNA-binding GntR family transcriptional regulator
MSEEPAVADALRAAILAGAYAPRQRLIEGDLCTEFGAGRFAVRGALRALAAEGLIEIERHKGARIREIPLSEAIEITEVRAVLEGLVASRAAERATRADVAELRAIVAAMRGAIRAGELLRYSELNARLHGAILALANHPTAAGLLERLRAQLVRHQFQLALLPGRPAVSLAQHEAIVAAIRARDPAAAEHAMREHVRSVLAALRSMQAPWPASSRAGAEQLRRGAP